MSFAAMLLSVANAVFDTTEQGVKNSFIHSFTGDFIIRPKSNVPLSLFGDETPVTGNLTVIDKIVPYTDIMATLNSYSEISSTVNQISGMAMMEFAGHRLPVSLFGVPGKDYVSTMDSIQILSGEPYSTQEKSIMLSSKIANKINAKVGDTIQFTVADGPSFRIRAATIRAIFSYKVDNAIFDKFVLVSPDVVRSLLGITENISSNIEIEEDKISLLEDDLDIMDLFGSADDVGAIFEEENTEETFSNENIIEEESSFENSSWNFIICKLKPNEKSNIIINKLNRTFKKNQWPVEAVNWRNAAGSTALYLYWMRIILNAGIIIVLIAGFIVVNNTLVINVMDRTQEIGTMRAIGASRFYISIEEMLETLILAFISAILGCILSFIVTEFITNIKITFSNSFLIQLFGSSALTIKLTFKNIVGIFSLMFGLGLIGWIYPVVNALKVNPVQAMYGAK